MGVLIGVEAVEHPARLDLDPADGRAAVAGQQPDSRLVAEFHTFGSSLPWVTAFRLNVTGRSSRTTYLAVSAKSCIIGPSGTAMWWCG